MEITYNIWIQVHVSTLHKYIKLSYYMSYGFIISMFKIAILTKNVFSFTFSKQLPARVIGANQKVCEVLRTRPQSHSRVESTRSNGNIIRRWKSLLLGHETENNVGGLCVSLIYSNVEKHIFIWNVTCSC